MALDEVSVRVDGLEADKARLVAQNTGFRRENAVLRTENAGLRRWLGLNSTKSGRPTSSDGLGKPPPMRARSAGRAASHRGRPDRGDPRRPGRDRGLNLQQRCNDTGYL
jgi:hypothetical protein